VELLGLDDRQGPPREPDQAAELGRQLKILAGEPGMNRPAVIAMAHLSPCAGRDHPLALRDLGLAAELVYDADTLLLLNGTQPHYLDVLVAKDRHGPAPMKTGITW
ncbi:hypothetical protein ACWGJ2_40195, partial [Streptomyces sp. NPDC054796]